VPNPNPYKARIAKRALRAKATRKAGSVTDVQEKLWDGVEAASRILADLDLDPQVRLRAIHALTQASGAYVKVLEASEFEARLKAVEEHLGEGDFI
jgi:hypothetical protein